MSPSRGGATIGSGLFMGWGYSIAGGVGGGRSTGAPPKQKGVVGRGGRVGGVRVGGSGSWPCPRVTSPGVVVGRWGPLCDTRGHVTQCDLRDPLV